MAEEIRAFGRQFIRRFWRKDESLGTWVQRNGRVLSSGLHISAAEGRQRVLNRRSSLCGVI